METEWNLFSHIAAKFSRLLEAERFPANEEIIMINENRNTFLGRDNDVGFLQEQAEKYSFITVQNYITNYEFLSLSGLISGLR